MCPYRQPGAAQKDACRDAGRTGSARKRSKLSVAPGVYAGDGALLRAVEKSLISLLLFFFPYITNKLSDVCP